MSKRDYDRGFIDGLRAFAYWKDGEEFVGTNPKRLRDVIEHKENTYGYNPPVEYERVEDIHHNERENTTTKVIRYIPEETNPQAKGIDE